MRQMRDVVALVVMVGLIGCGGDGLKRVPVTGTVKAKDGPVGNATLVFMPTEGTKGEGGIGSTDKDGNFTLTGSRQGAKGVVAGKYKVRVSRLMDKDGTILPSDAKEADYPHASESVPAPYSSPNSPLTVTVPDQGGTVNVDIPANTLRKKR